MQPNSGEIDVFSYFVPPIFIWDPVTVSKYRFPILCPQHHTEIFETGWIILIIREAQEY